MASLTKYPGINRSLRYYDNRGTSGTDFYRLASIDPVNSKPETPVLQVREVAMLIHMERLTDKPDWHEKIFDRAIVEKWKEEALAEPEEPLWDRIMAYTDDEPIKKPKFQRVLTERAFDYCIDELKCKAAYFNETGLVLTMNSNQNNVVKSDTAVSCELRQELKAAFEKLCRDQAADPDYHPMTFDRIQDLVHPSMYPFVYGKSIFFQDEVVGVQDAIEKWAGKGEISKEPYTEQDHPNLTRGQDPLGHIPDKYWSKKYQWLPANLAFNGDGTVRFTSYINNLHPKRYPEIYRAIERLIDTAIPAWELVLSGRAVKGSSTVEAAETPGEQKVEVGQSQQRFRHIPMPDDGVDLNEFWEDFDPERVAAHEQEHGEIRYNDSELDRPYLNDDIFGDLNEDEKKARRIIKLKWMHIRDAKLPEPLDFEPVTYSIQHKLKDKFKETGLQVIVKMITIKLDPDYPVFPHGSWRVEGLMNERIVATALFNVDSENTTRGCMHFSMSTDNPLDYMEGSSHGPGSPYEQLLGINVTDWGFGITLPIQRLGKVETYQGRMLAYPNVFRHSGVSFKLGDRTKPGHQSFIALYLVDPHQRIISTGNVPPQQLDWWAEAVFGGTGSEVSKGNLPAEVFQLLVEQGLAESIKPPQELLDSLQNRLPTEIMDMVRQKPALPNGIMTLEEAREHRLELMEENYWA